jgi:nucleoside-diphosphate-sugar epimerase
VRRLTVLGHPLTTFSLADGNIARDPLPATPAAHVVHLAAASFVPASWQDPAGFYEVNVQGTVRVLEYCRRHGAALTFISSYVYGQPQYLPVDEAHPVSPANPYAHTKLLGEEVCRFYQEKFGVPVCIVRPFNIYGPGQKPPMLIPFLVEQCLDPAQPVISVADSRPRRDYVYVDDLVELLALSCRVPVRGVFNAASGVSVSIPEIAAILSKWAGPREIHSRGEERPGEVLDLHGDSRKAAAELGWRPQTTLEEGLRQVWAARQAEVSRAAG